MDAAHIFRQGLGTVPPRQIQTFDPYQGQGYEADDFLDGDSSGQRVAHTLTACCRCRQRKTRCDPSLPRCRPCEKAGAICEYLDAAKGRKVNRYYVIKLQDKVRALEAELDQYTDEATDYPSTNEDIVRPGGMIRLSVSDETPRYLGPSSGIAMTRLLMEEAKRYTETNSISELIPEVRARRQARMQSIQMTGTPSGHKKSYPMISEHPAESLPTRAMATKLIEVFWKKCQIMWPALHEKMLHQTVEDVYNGDADHVKNFIVRMVFAISLQKLDTQYAGLADSYYQAAMKKFQDVLRPKDLKTLQCLVLVGQYSLITPASTPIYYVIGLATRICQQEGLTDEKTIATGYGLNAEIIDLRRRLVWIIATMEFGLSYYMGRPTGFAKGDDRMDVRFFATVGDDLISPDGIKEGPPCIPKVMAIHFYKMRLYQAEIRRALYEKKRAEPTNDAHQWFQNMEAKLKDWQDSTPDNFPWAVTWFSGFYEELRAFMYRPSPQIPLPSPRAAGICYDSCAYIINLTKKEMEVEAIDITWVFLVNLCTTLNTLLWSTSYDDVREKHAKEEVEELINVAVDCLDQCSERWPGTSSASQLYGIFTKACLQSYESKGNREMQNIFSFASPSSAGDQHGSPQTFVSGDGTNPLPYLNPPNFAYVFDSPPESMATYTFDPNFPPPQPSFRSNSIFCNPTTDSNGRRFSYFPPDFSQPPDAFPDDMSRNFGKLESDLVSVSEQMSSHIPTPPESMGGGNMTGTTPSTTFSPPAMATTLAEASVSIPMLPQARNTPPMKHMVAKADPAQRDPTFSIAPQVSAATQQRPLPTTAPMSGEWFSPLPPFMSPYNLGGAAPLFGADTMSSGPNFGEVPRSGMSFGSPTDFNAPFGFPQARQGSLSQSQQLELMNVLETEGMGEIDAYLNAGNGMPGDGRWY
ncbi:hypothetical protein VHEMI06241 [[Torrubiella] hemipterigena]|uniref:Zn(2)-C6 fungal-type domain-containing protein n=1 Tax=[Torrubiella] hemipterigena TaxID=1531966 RepID=A0A0A1T6L8_9HYPO|nr:hypothetical protein VHEMI06241 [[Torrubiella] hemipterigena]